MRGRNPRVSAAVAIAVTFSKGQMLAVAEGMVSFELRVNHFAALLAVSRDTRTRHVISVSVVQSLPVTFALAHHAEVVSYLFSRSSRSLSRWSHSDIGWAWNWP